MAPSAFETIFWVTTSTSSSRSGRCVGRRECLGDERREVVARDDLADAPRSGRPRPGQPPTVSGASAWASSRSSGVSMSSVSGPSSSSTRAPAAAAGLDVGILAVAAEAEVDDVGRAQHERIRAATVAVGDDGDERSRHVPCHRHQRRQHGGVDRRDVDGQDEDRLGARRDRLVARLAEPVVQPPAALPHRPGTGTEREVPDLVVRRDHQDLVHAGRRDRGADGPLGQAKGQVTPLLGVEDRAEPRLGAVERADRDDRDDRRSSRRNPASRTAAPRRRAWRGRRRRS